MVVVLDGYNDMQYPSMYGIRPGDTYYTPTTYNMRHDSPYFNVAVELNRRSALFRFWFMKGYVSDLKKHADNFKDNIATNEIVMKSSFSVYLQNHIQMSAICRQYNIPYVTMLQPIRPDCQKSSWLYNAGRLFDEELGKRKDFIAVSLKDKIEKHFFWDECHLNERGQMRLAGAMSEVLLEYLPSLYETKVGANIK